MLDRAALTAAARIAGAREIPLALALGELPEIRSLIEVGSLSPEHLAELTDPAGYLGLAAELTDRALAREPARPVVRREESDV